MTTIDCTDIKALLSPYIDGQLDEQTRHRAERHIAQCEACRNLVNQAEQLDALIAADVQAATPPGLSPDFFGSVMARTVYADPRSPRLTARSIATWTGWLTAAAAFIMAAGIWFNQNAQMVSTTTAASGNDAHRSLTTPGGTESRRAGDDFYHAGLELQSEAFDGVLPENVFRSGSEQFLHSSEQPLIGPATPRATFASLQHTPDLRAPSIPSIDREDADALYTASILMHLLKAADTRNLAQVEHVRRVVEADNLLPRLSEARDRLHPADRPAVFAAESLLARVQHGPLDSSDLLSLRDTVAALDLSNQLGGITERWDRGL